jgi:hypothetical protein
MLHFMTIGYLDVSLISRRRVEPLRSALADVFPLAVQWGFVDEVTKQPVDGCVIGDGWIRIPWYAPGGGPNSVKLAKQALECGLVVAYPSSRPHRG